ncbi:MAG: cupin domain-containing protein [Reyranellaceae bacterium]
MDAAAIIAALGLEKHPEGGWYREIHRARAAPGRRAAVTSIYYLLQAGERSHWHRVDAEEIWHFHAGAPLELCLSADGIASAAHVLGVDLAAGQRPQLVVPAGTWQSARALGGFSLIGCTVAPGFEFAGFELAPPHWRPGDAP